MAEKKKMSVAEILAAARAQGGGGAPSTQPKTEESTSDQAVAGPESAAGRGFDEAGACFEAGGCFEVPIWGPTERRRHPGGGSCKEGRG